MDKHTRGLMFSSSSSEMMTPDVIFDPLNERFRFTLDAAASHENHKVPLYYTQDGLYVQHFSTPHQLTNSDGLTGLWLRPAEQYAATARYVGGSRVWLNPPYGRGIINWVRKAATSLDPAVSVLLLPARTDTEWFHRWVLPLAEIHWIMGRITFWGHSGKCGHGPEVPSHPLDAAPFPSLVAIYERGSNKVGRQFAWDPRSSDAFYGGMRGAYGS